MINSSMLHYRENTHNLLGRWRVGWGIWILKRVPGEGRKEYREIHLIRREVPSSSSGITVSPSGPVTQRGGLKMLDMSFSAPGMWTMNRPPHQPQQKCFCIRRCCSPLTSLDNPVAWQSLPFSTGKNNVL